MTWETTYPTLATVKSASFDTLLTWDRKLPKPQTDVELTVRKRITQRLFELAGKECKQHNPEIAEQWNKIADILNQYDADIPKM